MPLKRLILRRRLLLLLLLPLALALTLLWLSVALISRQLHAGFYADESAAVLPWPSVCETAACRRGMLPGRIPAVRHLLWKSELMPKYFAEQVLTWSRLMPHWKTVLWRDADLQPLVAKHYPKMMDKFKSLKANIFKFDLLRYLIVHRYGGVYADADYILVRSLDEFLEVPAVLTTECEAHAAVAFGMRQWPPKRLANPALFMAEPGHAFVQFCIDKLRTRKASNVLHYGGPFGLTDFLYEYRKLLPLTNSSRHQLYIPPSYSFYSYENNSLLTSTSRYQGALRNRLRRLCGQRDRANSSQLAEFCKDVHNMNAITDSSVPVFAVHDNKKAMSTYDPAYRPDKTLVNLTAAIPGLVMADRIL